MYQSLIEQGVNQNLLRKVEQFRKDYPTENYLKNRISPFQFPYYGKEVWEKALTGLLIGKNLLLTGPKATGKNILSDNLIYLFQRPGWNISFHLNTDANYLIGTDTFRNDSVVFRPGPVYEAAMYGGFCVLDEINMAKNDSVVVLHSALDFRRILDVSGYDRLPLHPATRFIATMNYGYAGTRDLNEALLSRFMVIDMPPVTEKTLSQILSANFCLEKSCLKRFIRLFLDLQEKSLHSEISSKCVDLRGLISSIQAMQLGLGVKASFEIGLVNKSFDAYEKEIVTDCIHSLFPNHMEPSEIFQ